MRNFIEGRVWGSIHSTIIIPHQHKLLLHSFPQSQSSWVCMFVLSTAYHYQSLPAISFEQTLLAVIPLKPTGVCTVHSHTLEMERIGRLLFCQNFHCRQHSSEPLLAIYSTHPCSTSTCTWYSTKLAMITRSLQFGGLICQQGGKSRQLVCLSTASLWLSYWSAANELEVNVIVINPEHVYHKKS